MTAIPSIRLVLECTSEYFNIPAEVLTNMEYRALSVSQARHVACYVARLVTFKSFNQIKVGLNYDTGSSGGRSGAAYAFNKISKLIREDENCKTALDVLAVCDLVKQRLPVKPKVK